MSAIPDIIERFRAFDANHPEVFRAFERYALEALGAVMRSGRSTRIGAKAVWERLRWDHLLASTDQPALNNDFTPYYARMFMSRHPEFGRCFETRESAAEANHETVGG